MVPWVVSMPPLAVRTGAGASGPSPVRGGLVTSKIAVASFFLRVRQAGHHLGGGRRTLTR